MLKFLIVDDEEDVIELFQIIVEGRFSCEFFTATDGNQAIEVLKANPEIDLIISDFYMEKGSGDIIYNFNKENENRRPFLFVTGKSIRELSSCNDFDQNSKYDYLMGKPIKELVFLSAIENMIKVVQGEKTVDLADIHSEEIGEFKSLSIDTLKNIDLGSAELFVKIGKDKFIKVKNESDNFSGEEVLKYRKKAGDKLFVKKDYFAKLSKHAVQNINQKIASAEGESEVKMVAAELLDHIYEGFDQFGISSAQIGLVNDTVEKCQEVLSEKKGFKSLMGKFSNDEGYMIAHSMMAMHISAMISNNMGISTDRHLEKFSYACMLHDLALSDPNLSEIMDKNSDKFKRLSKEERDDILGHPQKIATFVEKKPEIPQDLYYILLEHHEKPDGTGFPRGLNATRISPMGALFIISLKVADHLYHHQFKNLKNLVIDLKENYSHGNFKKPCEAFFQSFKQTD